jgi:hypothetical protein
MSRIRTKKLGVQQSLVFTNQDRTEGSLMFDGTSFTLDKPLILDDTITHAGITFLPNGTESAPSLAFTNSTGLGIYRSAANVLGFCTAGNERMTLTAGGVLVVGDYVSIDSIGNSICGYKKVMEEAVTHVLSAEHSGTVFFINADTAAATYALPAAAAGLHFKWIWAGNNTNAMIIETSDHTDGATGEHFYGGVLVNHIAAINIFIEAGANENTMTFDDNVDNCAGGAGSWVEVYATEAKSWVVTGVLNGNTDSNGNGTAIFSNAA